MSAIFFYFPLSLNEAREEPLFTARSKKEPNIQISKEGLTKLFIV
jgi:hypothetical protein